jgi:hypothetical protein
VNSDFGFAIAVMVAFLYVAAKTTAHTGQGAQPNRGRRLNVV